MKYLILTFSILLFVACNKKTVCPEPTPKPFEFTLIKSGNLYGAGEENIDEGNRVIREEEEWLELIAKMDAVNDESSSFNETSIDFCEYMVIACFDFVRGNGGHSISATEIENLDASIDITVVKGSPSGEFTTTVITQPFYIAKIPKSEKLINFN